MEHKFELSIREGGGVRVSRDLRLSYIIIQWYTTQPCADDLVRLSLP